MQYANIILSIRLKALSIIIRSVWLKDLYTLIEQSQCYLVNKYTLIEQSDSSTNILTFYMTTILVQHSIT